MAKSKSKKSRAKSQPRKAKASAKKSRQIVAAPKTKKIKASVKRQTPAKKVIPPPSAAKNVRNAKRIAKAIQKKASKKAPKAKIVTVKSPASRDWKKAASALKKLGLAFQKTDLRKVKKPTAKQAKKVKDLEHVVSGKAKAYTVSKSDAKKYRASGFEVKGNKLILPERPGVKIRNKKGKIVKVQKMGSGEIRSMILPVPFHTLPEFLEELREDESLGGLRPPGSRIAFRFFGNQSVATFQNLQQLADYLEQYQNIHEAINSGNVKEQQEIYQNIEFVTVDSGKTWGTSRKEYARMYQKKRRYRESDYKKTYWARMKERQPQRYEAVAEKKRERALARYNSLKNNKAFKEKRRAYMAARRARGLSK